MQDRDEPFTAFVASRSTALLRTAYLLTGDHARAEDLLQTALAKTYLAWSRIEDIGAVEAYVRRAMVTTNVSWWRRLRGREVLVASAPEHGSAADETGLADDRDTMWRLLIGLPVKQRTALGAAVLGRSFRGGDRSPDGLRARHRQDAHRAWPRRAAVPDRRTDGDEGGAR